MGGYGSTRWEYHQKRRLVEESLQLDILSFGKFGSISGDNTSGTAYWHSSPDDILASILYEIYPVRHDLYGMRLKYVTECDGHTQNIEYETRIVPTEPHFGGSRWWFVCPLIVNGRKCEHRVRKLYLPAGEIYFGCRHCHRLTYRSCQDRDKKAAELSLLPVEQLMEMMQSGSVKSRLQAARALNVKLGI